MANENRQIHPMRKLVGPSRADIAYIFTFAQRWRRACVVEFELQLPKRPQAQQKTHRQIIRREHIAKSSKTRNSGQHRKTKKSLRATMEKPIQALKAKPNSTHHPWYQHIDAYCRNVYYCTECAFRLTAWCQYARDPADQRGNFGTLYNNCIAARKAVEGDVSVQQNAAPQGAMGGVNGWVQWCRRHGGRLIEWVSEC